MRRHTARVGARRRAPPCGTRKPSRFRRRPRRPRRRRRRAPVERARGKSGARFWTHDARRKRRVHGRRVAFLGPRATRERRRGFVLGVQRPRASNPASPRRVARRFQRARRGPRERLASELARRFRAGVRLTKVRMRSRAAGEFRGFKPRSRRERSLTARQRGAHGVTSSLAASR